MGRKPGGLSTSTHSRILRDRFTGLLAQADISDRKRAEVQLNHRTAELEQILQQLQHTQTQMIQSEKMSGFGQLVAGVAHEINNPVNFIFGNLSHANEYTKNILNILRTLSEILPNSRL